MNQLTTINTKGLDISKPKQFAEFVAQAQALSNVLEEAWGIVEQQMLERNVKQVKGDWGTLSIAERRNWKVTGQLPPRFYKQVVDTSKLNFMQAHGEKLPKGVSMSKSKYITKKLVKG
jgi:hypothetical protein